MSDFPKDDEGINHTLVGKGNVLSLSEFDHVYNRRGSSAKAAREDAEAQKRTWKSKLRCSKSSMLNTLRAYLPIVAWLPQYKPRDIVNDLIAGLTVGILSIPQGMAYAELAGTDAVHGLYTSFFPGLIYVFFGSSKHISCGTFAVICMMISSVRFKLSPDYEDLLETHNETFDFSPNRTLAFGDEPTPIEVTTALCFLTGIILFVMGLLRLGFLAFLLSDQVVGGFTTGAAIMVLSAQIPHCFGLNIHRYSGPAKLYYFFRDIVLSIPTSNPAAITVSIVCLIILFVFQTYVNSWLSKRTRFPFPIDLIVMIIATGVSYAAKLNKLHKVAIVYHVPTGVPTPVIPKFELIPQMVVDAIAISIVLFAVAASLAKMFAKKHQYRVDINQELFAFGITNIAVSFLNCFTAAAALARTAVNDNAGAKSQISCVIASFVVLLVIFFIGPLFEHLPKCVLACVIIVALKSLLMQFGELKKLWHLSKVDCAIWMITFLATCVLDLTYGLAVGVISALFGLVYRTRSFPAYLLGRVPHTEIYVNQDTCGKELDHSPGVHVFRFDAPLCYLNVEYFRDELFRLLPELLQPRSTTAPRSHSDVESDLVSETSPLQVKRVIIDCAAISFIDTMALTALQQICATLRKENVKCMLANLTPSVLTMLRNSGAIKCFGESAVFMSVSDAVAAAENEMTNETEIGQTM